MKVCEICGTEIFTKDGENRCDTCEDTEAAPQSAEAEKKLAAKRRAAANRKARNEVMRSLGMTKVRGTMGGTYWE